MNEIEIAFIDIRVIEMIVHRGMLQRVVLHMKTPLLRRDYIIKDG